MAASTKLRFKLWSHWVTYARTYGIKPYFSKPNEQVVTLLKGFAARVRRGACGNGKRVRAPSVRLALSAIGQTIVLDGQAFTNPLHTPEGKLILPLHYLIQAYTNQDPPSLPSLAVPVELVEAALNLHRKGTKRQQRTAQLMVVAYYFLLRVGEYTKPNKQTRTVQFRLKDVIFWRNGFQINPRIASLETLMSCESATLRISNQKNGKKNQTIFHEATGSPACPIVTLAHIVKDVCSFSKDDDEMLCAFKQGSVTSHVVNSDISQMIKHTAKVINLPQRGFPLSRLAPHSLRAGGATALAIAGWDTVIIKKYGRWSSCTFLTYIHEQIAALGKNVSKSMATKHRFHNIAGFST